MNMCPRRTAGNLRPKVVDVFEVLNGSAHEVLYCKTECSPISCLGLAPVCFGLIAYLSFVQGTWALQRFPHLHFPTSRSTYLTVKKYAYKALYKSQIFVPCLGVVFSCQSLHNAAGLQDCMCCLLPRRWQREFMRCALRLCQRSVSASQPGLRKPSLI